MSFFTPQFLYSWQRSLTRAGKTRSGFWPWSLSWEEAIKRKQVKGEAKPQVFLNGIPLEELEAKVHRYRSRPAFLRGLQSLFTSIKRQEALYLYYKERTVFSFAVREAKLSRDELDVVLGFSKTTHRPSEPRREAMLSHQNTPAAQPQVAAPKKGFFSALKDIFFESAEEKNKRLQAEAVELRVNADHIILNWIRDEFEAAAQQIKAILTTGRDYSEVKQQVATVWRKLEQDKQFELEQILADYDRQNYLGVDKNNHDEIRARFYNKNRSLFNVYLNRYKSDLKDFEKSLQKDSQEALFGWTQKRFEKDLKTIKTAILRNKSYEKIVKREQDLAQNRQSEFEILLARHAKRFYPTEGSAQQESRAYFMERARRGLLGSHNASYNVDILHFGMKGNHPHVEAFRARAEQTALALPNGKRFIEIDTESDARKSLIEYLKENENAYCVSAEASTQATWLHGYLYRVERCFDQIIREGEHALGFGKSCLKGEERGKVQAEVTRRLDSLYREAALALHPDRPVHAEAEPWLQEELTVIFNKLNELRSEKVEKWKDLVADESRRRPSPPPSKKDCQFAEAVRLYERAQREKSYLPIDIQKMRDRWAEATTLELERHAADKERARQAALEAQEKIQQAEAKAKQQLEAARQEAEEAKKQARQQLEAARQELEEAKKQAQQLEAQTQQQLEAVRQEAEKRITQVEQKAEAKTAALEAQMKEVLIPELLKKVAQANVSEEVRAKIMSQITPFLDQAAQSTAPASVAAHIA